MFDEVLEAACKKDHDNQWQLPCDHPSESPEEIDLKKVLLQVHELMNYFFPFHMYLNHILDCATFYYVDGAHAVCFQILHFTALLIEHSFTRHLYSSMEHLSTLLASSDMTVVLAVLNLLYVFSKRSNFITRFSGDKKQLLVDRLTHLAEVIHHVAYTRKNFVVNQQIIKLCYLYVLSSIMFHTCIFFGYYD